MTSRTLPGITFGRWESRQPADSADLPAWFELTTCGGDCE